MNHFFAPGALVAYYEDNSGHEDTTDIRQQRVSYDSSQVQQFGGTSDNVHTYASAFNNQMGTPHVNPTFRLMHIKDQVVAFCADANGSRFIQQAIEVATIEEIVMVYEEITPYVCMLSIDVFGNHAIQKILNHGPQLYKRIFINHLMGHVFGLSLHMYGCRVIQKVFDVAEQDQRLEMAKELSSKVLICVCDKFANYVIQKCMECLPSKNIEFIFQSLRGKVAALSTHAYGWHVVKKMLAYSSHSPEIHHMVTAEIIESAKVLSADQYGNYVVQHLLEHGSPIKRSMMVTEFVGRIVTMSYNKHASNVIDKCLTFGCDRDRQVITNEIISTGGAEHFDDLIMVGVLDMMIHPYASLVIQKMVETAEEQKICMLLGVAWSKSNMDNLKRNQHGRHVIAAMEKFIAAKGKHASLLCPCHHL
ncbi:hypothetical protein HU200_040339 [Digitaria exilis]|uniref:PUM-HD domain-containing protein n=1 Tax=Digitaria exilis TaxID=1010633 RepID=A0A835EEG6_9POAL|nr:hypothetical protein HU200_040339 [Digitaria exilis]